MTDDYNPERDFAESLRLGYAAIRARESAKPESARSYEFAKREFVPPDATGEDHGHRV